MITTFIITKQNSAVQGNQYSVKINEIRLVEIKLLVHTLKSMLQRECNYSKEL